MNVMEAFEGKQAGTQANTRLCRSSWLFPRGTRPRVSSDSFARFPVSTILLVFPFFFSSLLPVFSDQVIAKHLDRTARLGNKTPDSGAFFPPSALHVYLKTPRSNEDR